MYKNSFEDGAVGMRLRAIGNLMKRYACQSPFGKKCEELTNMHGYVLVYITHNVLKGNVVLQRDIEKQFEMRRSTATEMLQLMEKNGLIKRVCLDNDKRMKRIVLTQKALELHNMAIADCKTAEKMLVEGLSEQEIDTLNVLLDKVKKNIQCHTECEHKDEF